MLDLNVSVAIEEKNGEFANVLTPKAKKVPAICVGEVVQVERSRLVRAITVQVTRGIAVVPVQLVLRPKQFGEVPQAKEAVESGERGGIHGCRGDADDAYRIHGDIC